MPTEGHSCHLFCIDIWQVDLLPQIETKRISREFFLLYYFLFSFSFFFFFFLIFVSLFSFSFFSFSFLFFSFYVSFFFFFSSFLFSLSSPLFSPFSFLFLCPFLFFFFFICIIHTYSSSISPDIHPNTMASWFTSFKVSFMPLVWEKCW